MIDITFGLRCPSSIVHSVVRTLENSEGDLKFYQMHQVRGSYALSRTEVELGEIENYYPRTSRSGIEIFGPIDSY
ncbi:hypothetical protein [Pseudoalteromonas sp. A757]|uniref:hypothetical protein n=1 Tax=Pseudoalteromonas sp. A757 TaxID=2250709 RepID=UPI00195F416B|nr:hypothetical protein [Pseudoalteromonas sp. A757]